MDRRFVVYLLTNTVNGKQYVGVTTCGIQRRWKGHKRSAALGEKTRIAIAIAKHGVDAFTIEHIASSFDRHSMLATEIALIAQFGTNIRKRGYNVTAGGDSPAPMTDEWRANLSAAGIGRKLSAKHRASVSAAKVGVSPSPEARNLTGRNQQVNLKVRAEDAEAFYAIAKSQGWLLGDVFARAIAALARERAER